MTQRSLLMVVVGMFLALARGGGEEPVSKFDFGFDATSVAPPVGDQKPIARVFTKYIYLNDVEAKSAALDGEAVARLRGLILHALMDRFAEKSGITATDDEADQFGLALASAAGRAALLGLCRHVPSSHSGCWWE